MAEAALDVITIGRSSVDLYGQQMVWMAAALTNDAAIENVVGYINTLK